jgi:hypothetical protein
MATAELKAHGELVKQWACKQPAKYRMSALALGYRMNHETHSFRISVKAISDLAEEHGQFVAESTLKRDLEVFEHYGLVTIERPVDEYGERAKDPLTGALLSNLYTVDFGKVLTEDQAREARLHRRILRRRKQEPANLAPVALGKPVVAPKPAPVVVRHTGNGGDDCPRCVALMSGGKDPYDVVDEHDEATNQH